MELGGFRVFISLAQVVAAMAAGALLPVTAFLALEVHRPRPSGQESAPRAAPPEPGRVVDDDAQGAVDEVLAQLAAAQFELLGQSDETAQHHPERHLTLIPTARGPRRPAAAPAGKKRSTHSQWAPGCAAGHPDVPRRSSQPAAWD